MIERLKEDFKDFENDCLAVLLFGSATDRTKTVRSDIDICIVKPVPRVLDRIYAKLGGKYDVKVFEELPLYVRIEVMKHHKVIYGDALELSEYFHLLRRIWKDMEPRIAGNAFKDFEERMRLRRRWLDEKEKILRETRGI